jgi:hypothetical protein
MGYFAGDPGPGKPFYAARGLRFEPDGPLLRSEQTLQLNCKTAAKVTLLMDPFARVHATSGVLPRCFLELPEAELVAARQANETFFQVAPVLGSELMPQIPRAPDDFGDWSWARRVYQENAPADWRVDTDFVTTSDQERDSVHWPTISEGWLKLKIAPVRIRSFWYNGDVERPALGSLVIISWSIRGDADITLCKLSGDQLKDCEKCAPTGPSEYAWNISEDSIFELKAVDEYGNRDQKRLNIKVG